MIAELVVSIIFLIVTLLGYKAKSVSVIYVIAAIVLLVMAIGRIIFELVATGVGLASLAVLFSKSPKNASNSIYAIFSGMKFTKALATIDNDSSVTPKGAYQELVGTQSSPDGDINTYLWEFTDTETCTKRLRLDMQVQNDKVIFVNITDLTNQ